MKAYDQNNWSLEQRVLWVLLSSIDQKRDFDKIAVMEYVENMMPLYSTAAAFNMSKVEK